MPSILNSNATKRGAQPGNQNAAAEKPKTAFLGVRCLSNDKGNWVSAANKAKRSGAITREEIGKSLLAAWVCKTLNAAAARQLGSEFKE